MKKKRADAQIFDLVGELFVAAELLKRGLQASITFGNAKAIDLFATHPTTNRKFTIQVKTLRNPNYFPSTTAGVRPRMSTSLSCSIKWVKRLSITSFLVDHSRRAHSCLGVRFGRRGCLAFIQNT
jgi:hypothetical protein